MILLAVIFLASANPDAVTFRKICGACHTTAMVTDLMTHDEWEETIAHMQENGAKGSPADFAAVRRYLARERTRVNVNTAPADQLAAALAISLPAAKAIVSYRTTHGNFATVEDILKVPGVRTVRTERLAF